MENITIKQVCEESFSSVALYLDYILTITKELGVPYYITLDGVRYLVTRVEADKGMLYACAYEQDGKIKSYGISIPNNNPGYCSLTDGVTILRDFSNMKDHPFVLKENVVNDNIEQVTIDQDRDGSTILVYYQTDASRNMDCEITYDLKGHENNVSSYLNYISSKYPKSIIIGEDTKLLKVIKHRKTEIYRYSDSQYLVPSLNLFGYEFASVKSAVELEKVLSNVRMNGFNYCIPKYIADTFAHRNEVERNMKILAKVYDENCMKNH